MALFVFIKKQCGLRLSGPVKRGLITVQRVNRRDHAPPGLLRGGCGDLLPPGELFLSGLSVEPDHTAAAGKRQDLGGAQLRRLLDHMLNLIPFGVGHVDGSKHPGLCI